jgi:hypothetical protein
LEECHRAFRVRGGEGLGQLCQCGSGGHIEQRCRALISERIGAIQLGGPQHALFGGGTFDLAESHAISDVVERNSGIELEARESGAECDTEVLAIAREGECALVHVERDTNHVTFFHLLAVLTVGLAVVVRVARGGTVVGPALGGVVLANVRIQLLMSLAHADHDVGRARALLQDHFPAPHTARDVLLGQHSAPASRGEGVGGGSELILVEIEVRVTQLAIESDRIGARSGACVEQIELLAAASERVQTDHYAVLQREHVHHELQHELADQLRAVGLRQLREQISGDHLLVLLVQIGTHAEHVLNGVVHLGAKVLATAQLEHGSKCVLAEPVLDGLVVTNVRKECERGFEEFLRLFHAVRLVELLCVLVDHTHDALGNARVEQTRGTE